MRAEEEITRIGEELEQARQDFQETLVKIDQKVKRTESRINPERLVKRFPLTACSLAAGLGFFVGQRDKGRTIALAFAIGGLLGKMLKPRREQRPESITENGGC